MSDQGVQTQGMSAGGPAAIVPGVIIGLGGTGGEVLLRIRKKFFEASKSFGLEEWPIVRYLYIDTDMADRDVDRFHGDFFDFSKTEFFPATLDDWSAFTQNLQNYPTLREWWYEDQTPLMSRSLNAGAGQIRGYSRLAMWKHSDALIQRFGNLVREARDPDAAKALANRGINVDTTKVWVYVVSSLAGGTGSGALLDVGYMLRQLSAPGLETMAFAVLPSVFDYLPIQNDRLRANSYAALSEMEYYSGLKLRHGKFDDQWANGLPTAPTELAPYTRTFVIDGENTGNFAVGAQKAREGLFEMIADHIAMDYTVSHFGDMKRSAYPNQDQYLHGVYSYEHRDPADGERVLLREPFSKSYQTFGISKLYLPIERIRKSCAFELWSRAFRRFAGTLVADNMDSVRDQVLKSGRVPVYRGVMRVRGQSQSVDGFAENLKKDDSRGSVVKTVQDSVRQLRQRAFDGTSPELQRCVYLSGEAEAMFDEFFLEPVKDRSGYKEWGGIYRQMEANRLRYIELCKSDLRSVAIEFAGDPNRGVGFSIDFVQGMRRYLVGEAQGLVPLLTKELADAKKELGVARTDFDSSVLALSEHERWNPMQAPLLKDITIKHDIETCCARIREWLTGVIDVRFLDDAIDVCRELGDYCKELAAELERTQTELLRFSEQFAMRAVEFAQESVSSLNECPYQTSDVRERYLPFSLLGTYPAGDEEIDQECVKRARLMLEDMRVDIGGSQEKGLSIYDFPRVASKWGSERFETELASRALGEFGKLDEVNVVNVFTEKVTDPATRQTIIEKLVGRALPWYARHPAFSDSKAEHTTIVYTYPESEGVEFQEFKKAVENAVSARFSTPAKAQAREKHTVAFFTQMAGFPLCFGAAIPGLHHAYTQSVIEGNDRLHISRKEWLFPSIVHQTSQDVNRQREAMEVFLIGLALGVIKPRNEQIAGTTSTRCIYSYMRMKDGILRPASLGIRRSAIQKLMDEASTKAAISEAIQKRMSELRRDGQMEYAQALLRHYYDEGGPYASEKYLDSRNYARERLSLEHVVLSDFHNEHFGEEPNPRVIELMGRLESFSRELDDGHRALLDHIPSAGVVEDVSRSGV